MVIQFISTLILARLLTPEEIGIFSVAAVIIGFAQMIRDFGVANYLVAEKELTTTRIRTALGVTLIFAWLMAIIIYTTKGYIADFYDEPGVEAVLIVLSISFILIPFNSTVLGLLRRELRFDIIFKISLISALCHACTAIVLAYNDFGFISLAWASLAGTIGTILIAILHKPSNAQFIPSLKEFKRVFSFGSSSSAASLISEAGLSTPDLAIGRNLGFNSLGFYSRAMGLIGIFNKLITSAVQPIVLPAFSEKHRNNESLRDPYLKIFSYFSALSWPFFLMLAITTLPVIRLLYGDQWDEAAPIARILCISFALQPFFYFSNPGLIAIGKIHSVLIAQLSLQTPRIILTIYASFYDLFYVAWVQVVFSVACIIYFHVLFHRKIDVSSRDLITSSSKSIMVTIISVAPPYYLLNSYEDLNVIAIYLLWAFLWLIGIFIVKHPICYELSTYIKRILHKQT